MGEPAESQIHRDRVPTGALPSGLRPEDIRELEEGEATTQIWSYLAEDYEKGIEAIGRAVRKDGMPPTLTSSREFAVWLLSRAASAEANRKPLRRFWFEPVVLLVVAGLIGLMVVTWQRAGTGPPQPSGIPGFEQAVTRSFRPATAGTAGVSLLRFGVAGFDTGAHAEEGMRLLTERLLATPGFEGLRATSAPAVGSETIAFVGEVELRGVRIAAAVLVVRDGNAVHVMEGYGAGADPLPSLMETGARLFGAAAVPAPPPDVDYTAGERWDELPRLEHLPPGFTLAAEEDGLAGDLLEGVATPAVAVPAGNQR